MVVCRAFNLFSSSKGSLISISDSVFCFYGTQVYLGSDLWVRVSLTKRGFANLTDVTLADEDTNSILTDNANRAIQGNVAIQVTRPGGQLWKQCKWRHLTTKC